MSKTLTTEQLRARAKFWREKAVEAKWESVNIAQDMLQNADAFDELAANREAQPVGYIDPDSLKEYRGKPAGGSWSAVPRTTCGLNMTVPIYLTAPPAPAMVGELLEAMEEVIRISDRNHVAWARAKAAITAFRTAILQHVSQGYKLAPIEPTEQMVIHGFESNAMDALADAVNEANSWPYSCRESAECVKGIYKAMLAAAPNGGNSPEIPDGWVSCEERMPEEGDVVLVCQEGGIIYCAEMQDGELYPDEFPRVPSEGREITHWMPLPAAPTKGEKQ
ncbi:Protein of uncharacterised function (DUF551) [Serratia marcescens]|uniref:DUF551 domain-containing protein n=1 Tax=Serratia marcescens TaxID=615 RepID=UPI002178B4C7|nr:DUF551 domain-containing protein [Serratia marcescens]CAI2006118.1 Protein of uncharacterised function (DUF551) [Serratia marcescens]